MQIKDIKDKQKNRLLWSSKIETDIEFLYISTVCLTPCKQLETVIYSLRVRIISKNNISLL